MAEIGIPGERNGQRNKLTAADPGGRASGIAPPSARQVEHTVNVLGIAAVEDGASGRRVLIDPYGDPRNSPRSTVAGCADRDCRTVADVDRAIAGPVAARQYDGHPGCLDGGVAADREISLIQNIVAWL